MRVLLAAILLCAFVPTLSLAGPTFQSPRVSAPFLLSGGEGDQVSPRLAGNLMVYSDCRGDHCNIWGVDLTARRPFPISTQAWAEKEPSTDGARVVWVDYRNAAVGDPDDLLDNFDIFGANLGDKKEFAVDRSARMQNRPSISGNVVVWADFRGAKSSTDSEAGDIYMYDIAAGKEMLVSGARSAQVRPATNGRYIVWQDYRNEPNPTGDNADIYGYDLATRQEFPISTAPGTQQDPAISGNIVVWTDYRSGENTSDIYGYDLTTKKEFPISTAPGSQITPATYGNIVVWADYRNEPDKQNGSNSDIYGYDLNSKREFPIFVGSGTQWHPSVTGNTVAWENDTRSNDETDIEGATIAGITVTPPAPMLLLPPGTSARTFPETGKTVVGLFADYWNKNGGLAQQGFPISELMSEVSDLDGKRYTVQYFERAVFEYHPENPPPYNVLLSQLGTFRYKQKYPNGAPGQQPQVGGRLFPETGKSISGRFLEYWQQNGGLAQQGYPISDPFVEKSDVDGNDYTVQYFERAVFELHPEKQRPYDVLLSLLGAFRNREKYGGK